MVTEYVMLLLNYYCMRAHILGLGVTIGLGNFFLDGCSLERLDTIGQLPTADTNLTDANRHSCKTTRHRPS